MREIPDPKSTMGEWYNIKSFPVLKKTGKLFPCFFCYIGTFLYYEGNYFPVFEGKSLPVFLLYRNISLLSRKIIPVFLQRTDQVSKWFPLDFQVANGLDYPSSDPKWQRERRALIGQLQYHQKEPYTRYQILNMICKWTKIICSSHRPCSIYILSQ